MTGLATLDRRERACRLRETCPCTHTACRDGWLDDPDHQDLAHRCPTCWDAWRAFHP